MSQITINNLTGHPPFTISVCDVTLDTCIIVLTGVTSVPPVLNISIPLEFTLVENLVVMATDSIGCEVFNVGFCSNQCTPTPTVTPTVTPTITSTPSNSLCTKFDNQTSESIEYFINTPDGSCIGGLLYPYTTIYHCGNNPSIGSGGTITVFDPCVDGGCINPTPTPTATPTITPSLPYLVGYFMDCCNPSNEFTLSNIPLSLYPLSDTYFIVSDGFIGCATSIVSTSSSSIYSCGDIAYMNTCEDCLIFNPTYLCPTPSPTVTNTPSPSV